MADNAPLSRFGADTANARSLPEASCPARTETVPIATSVWPPSTDSTNSFAPLNGTIVIFF